MTTALTKMKVSTPRRLTIVGGAAGLVMLFGAAASRSEEPRTFEADSGGHRDAEISTAFKAPETATEAEPTATAEPPTATPEAPTATPEPPTPTSTPEPPTPTLVPPTFTPVPVAQLVDRTGCDPSYPTVCIQPKSVVGDLNCSDVPYRMFRVLPPDLHGFDGKDNDGWGCENN